MSGRGFQDWRDLGVWPLQDHQDGQKSTRRRQLVGGRLAKMVDPSVDGTAAHAEYAREGPQGTLGDIHPWLFWQTAGKDRRGTGSWAMAFAGLTGDAQSSGGGPITGPPTAGVQPVRTSSWESDLRYGGKMPGWPAGFPRLPKGTVVAVMPAMEETRQVELTLHADPRLIAANIDGPGEAGTLVCDLQPNLEPCMDNSTVPGLGGRHARLQSMMRVVAFSPGGGGGTLSSPGNALAWNLSRSGLEGLLGCGAVWIQAIGGGPITPGGSSGGPLTPGGGTQFPRDFTIGTPSNPGNLLLDGGGDPPPMEGEILPANLDGAEHIGKKPNQYGRFSARPGGNHVVAFMANAEAFGPICGGSMADKHTHGRDRDGNPLVAAHISTNAYVYDDADRDGPYLFEGKYPNPGPLPLMSRVHLTWDGALQHPFAGGMKMGKWRWWAEVPFMAPTTGSPPTKIPPTGRPGGPTTGGPGRPGFPGGPGAPGVPGAPTTGQPAPPRGGGPPVPSGPITPNPMGPGGPRFPGYPTTGGGRGPSAPPRPGMPVGGGSGPGTGGGDGPSATPPSGPAGPAGPSGPTTPGGSGPTAPEPSGPGRVPPEPPPPFDPFRDWPGSPLATLDDPNSEAPFFDPNGAPGVVATVGATSVGDVANYAIHHPLMESFAALAFRPQRWGRGFVAFEHNPGLPASYLRDEEAFRPQVLAVRPWGAQTDDGEFDYAKEPDVSRARGGIADGGLLFSPPGFEMEDYLGMGDADVDDPCSAAYLTAAPGVSFALGTPVLDGGLAAAGVVITRNTDANRTLLVQQLASDRVATTLLSGWVDQSTNELGVAVHGSQALRIPRGADATRPASPVGGELRVNSEGANDVLEFWDEQGTTWTPAASGGGGGAPTGAEYIVGSLNGSLSAERAVTTTATISWDLGTASQAKANVVASSIGNAQLRDGAAVSVVGRSANSTGALADIAAGSNGHALRRESDVVGFGTLAAGAFADNTIALARLVNAADPCIVGSLAGGGPIQEIAASAPSSVAPVATDILHKFASGGAYQRCTFQQVLDLIGTYFGISPP